VQQKNHLLLLVDNTPSSLLATLIEADSVIAEADDFEALAGPNPYSRFLRKHGCRPSPDQASTIGRLMGARVRASDGSLQPVLTKGERSAIRDIRKRRKEWAQLFDNAQRTANAVVGLAQNHIEPSTVFGYRREKFASDEFLKQIDSAVRWLNRFAEEAHRHAESSCPKVRHSLSKILDALPSGGLTPEQIGVTLKAKYQKAITEDNADLVDIAITRVVNQVISRRAKSNISGQLELFAEFKVTPRVYVTVETEHGLERVVKNLGTLTNEEVQRQKERIERPIIRGIANSEFVRLADAMKASGANPKETVDEWWMARSKSSDPKS
jgi:hypothetical protein